MTPLEGLLIRRIAQSGPLSVAEYMAECLLHPEHGYYATRDPFGVAGDFTTAPEISQMYGELLGLCIAQSWLDQGAPGEFTLAELGPGRGTLMADVLRATKGVPGFHAAMRLVLVEASAYLRGVQARRLEAYAPDWVSDVGGLDERPLFLIANEFFDALPVHQFQRDEAGWRERLVGVQDGGLVFGLSASVPGPGPAFAADPPGTVVEICSALRGIGPAIADRIARHGGVALVVDYGGWRSKGDTLQAVRGHKPEGVLDTPGQADLTVHVDFEALAHAMPGVMRTGLTDQGVFLERLGIRQRAARLAQSLSGDALETHLAALHRLTVRSEMGSLFKAIAFHTAGTPAPPGFDPTHA